MKIMLMNIYYFPNLAGGAEISVMKLAEQLASDADNEVEVLCVAEDDVFKQEKINNVNVFRLPLRTRRAGYLRRRIDRVFNFTDYKTILEFLQKHKPDVIHTNNLRSFSVAIWKAAKMLNIPIVHSLRDYVLIDIYRYKSEKAIIKKYSNFVTAATAPSMCTLNKHLEAGLFSDSKIKSAIVNAIDINIEQTVQLFNEKRGSRQQKDNLDFAYIGRFSEEKGVDWLIDVFNKTEKECKLHLFGKGELKESTKEIINQNKRIIDHGMVSEEILNESLKNIDVVIVPSLWEEPFGRVILDSYKNSIPVIVTNRGGMPENVVNGKTGLIIEPTDDELSDAIQTLKNTQLIDSMCSNIIKQLPDYSVEIQAEKFLGIYKQITD